MGSRALVFGFGPWSGSPIGDLRDAADLSHRRIAGKPRG